MTRLNRLAILVTGFCIAVLLFPWPHDRTTIRGVQTINMSRGKQLANACILYTVDHGGRFPMHLIELEPHFVAQGRLAELRCSSVGRFYEPKYEMDWLYFGAGFDDENRPRLLIASPQAPTTDKVPKRVVVCGDISVQIMKEDEYEQLLGETVKQMEALQEFRKTQPVPAVPEPPTAH